MLRTSLTPYARELLPSGGVAYWQHTPDVEYIKLGVIVKAGSALDPPGKNGLAHLVEHMSCHSTDAYQDIKRLISPVIRLGGMFEAETMPNSTVYTVCVPTQSAALAWEILEQICFHAKLDQKNFEHQLADIKTEIIVDDDGFPPKSMVDKIFTQIFSRQFVSAIDIGGTSRTLNTISLAAVRNWYKKNYQPDNMVFVAGGNLTGLGQSWPEWLNQKLAGYSPRPPRQWLFPLPSPEVRPYQWRMYLEGIVHPQVSIYSRLTGIDLSVSGYERARRIQMLDIVLDILANTGITSVLERVLRDKHNLVYEIHADQFELAPTAYYWEINTITKSQASAERVPGLIAKTLRDPIIWSPECVDEGKQFELFELSCEHETPISAFNTAMEYIASGQPILTFAQRVELINSITPADIERMIQTDFTPKNWVVASYLPYQE